MLSVAHAANAFLTIFNELPDAIRTLAYAAFGMFMVLVIIRTLMSL